MRLVRLALLMLGILIFGTTPLAAESSCTAQCTGCGTFAPSCSASCAGSAHCQGGECEGLHVGCCCLGDGTYFCVSTSCGLRAPQLTADPDPNGEWGLLTYEMSTDGSVQSLSSPYASSTAFAQELMYDESLATLPDLGAVLEHLGPQESRKVTEDNIRPSSRLVLAPMNGGSAQGMDPEQLDKMRELLTARIPDNQKEGGQFAIRLSGDRSEILFSTHPALSNFLAEHIETLRAQETNETSRSAVDVFLIEVRDGAVHSLLHTSTLPNP